MSKLSALLELFKKGRAVANPAAWKAGQIGVTALAAAIAALFHALDAYGAKLPVDPSTCDALAGGLIALVNVVLTLTTSKTVGVGAVRDEVQPVPGAAAGAAEAGRASDSGGAD